ncbi:ribonuclease H-like domain-containing protein, partial [Lobosporangium transversale]
LVWIDCETTGLTDTDKLLEIAVIITDDNLNIVAEGPNLIINQPKEIMSRMDKWCTEQHEKSGLTAAVLTSEISTEEACNQVLQFIKQHIPQPRRGILAGSSVHFDKKFLEREMTPVVNHLHYRIIDVSTIKELSKRWFPGEYKKLPEKVGTHRALKDIKDSIRELQFYRDTVFKRT